MEARYDKSETLQAKVGALQRMNLHAQRVHGRPVLSLLDIGMGDMKCLEAWDRWDQVYYMGVTSCADVVAAARKRYPDLLFLEMQFNQLVSEGIMDVMPPDVILLLDVLYCLPDAELEAALLDCVYSSPAEYIILSHAAGQWSRPEGWDIIHVDCYGSQRLVVLTRSN